MLSSITPFGERARNQRYWVTAMWFTAGAISGGGALGAVVAALAGLVSVTTGGSVPLAGVVLIAASAWEVSGWPIPGLHRQVDETWLVRYRGWVYGLGFGFQLGLGFATYVTSALVWGFVVSGAVLGRPTVAFVAGLVFGATRGVLILLSARVRDPRGLRRLFDGLHGALSWATWSGAAAVTAVVVVWWVVR